MKKSTLSILIILTATLFSFGQGKQLSLEDAVLRQYSHFYPSTLPGIQWIGGEEAVSWLSDDYNALIRFQVKDQSMDTIVKLSDLNEALELELKRIRNPKWIDDNSFYFSNSGHYYTYNYKKKKGAKWLELPRGRNMTFNQKAEAFAFTEENNLLIKENGEEAFMITNHEDKNLVAGQAIARHEFGITKGIFWAPDGKSLAFYQKDESEVSSYPLLDISTTPGSLKEVKYPMAGQGSEYASVGVYNRKTKTSTYLQVEGPRDQFLTNLAWGPESKYIYLAVLNREQNHMKLNKYSASTGKFVQTLFEEKHDKYVEPEQAVQFIPGSKNEFLWFSERDGFNHIYRYNTDGKLINQVTSGKWEVQQILGYAKKKKHVFVMGTDESGLNRYLYRSSLGDKSSKNLSTLKGVHRFTLSENGKYLIDQYSSPKIPGNIDLIDNNGSLLSNLHQAKNPLSNYRMATATQIDLEAEDGTILHARMIKPSHFDPSKKYPVLTYVYGGPHAQMISNRWLMSAPLWMYYFAEQGYLVFTLDNRGSANRGFDFENVIHRQLGEIELKDQLTGVEYLHSLPYVDKGRMAVHGWSYGGFMTSSLMLKTPGVYQAGVAGGPVTDWKYYEIMYGERYMDTPQENPEGYELTSLLNKADKLEGDLLLIHGTIDDVVVMQHNLSLVNEFVKAGKQVEFFPYPMHPHNVRGKDRLHLMTKVLDFVEEKIGVE